jgi:hypothetical protein
MPANYVLLQQVTLASAAASVTFSGIPTTGYTDLQIMVSGRSNRGGAVEDSVRVRVGNGSVDTGANYSYNYLYEYDNGNITAGSATGQTGASWQSPVSATNATGGIFGNSSYYIPNYTVNAAKVFSGDSATENNGTPQLLGYSGGTWSGTSAINIINLAPTSGTAFDINSTFSLYGIAALGTTPTVLPKATGGDIINNDGTYWYHAFLSSGTFIPSQALTADVLEIAGGGGGSAGGGSPFATGGGGGAGGIFYATAQSLTANTAINCIIGAGGVKSVSSLGGLATSGNNSQFSSFTAAIGGAYGGYFTNGGNGGSGGGAGGNGYSAGTSTQTGTGGTGYGTSGASSSGNDAGGGGGAGAAGGGRTGGAGLNTWSAWASATGTGVSGYYAGGGGGGSYSGGSTTAAAGGGGQGGAQSYATAGTASTGSGGGGGSSLYNYSTGGQDGTNGGSGIVIVRYPMV